MLKKYTYTFETEEIRDCRDCPIFDISIMEEDNGEGFITYVLYCGNDKQVDTVDWEEGLDILIKDCPLKEVQ